MEIHKYELSVFIVLTVVIQNFANVQGIEHRTKQLDEIFNPITSVTLNENEIGYVNGYGDHTKDTLSRVKRQFYYGYNPYYHRPRPPIFLPIFGGGGWYGGRGFGGYGGRGYGGGGFGGRGFGGRGFGGRGFGGRGFGGRGFGGIGHGFGGGRGGRG